MNDLNFSSMKHRVLSHARHAGPAESSPDIPNAHRLFFQESIRSMGQTASMFPSSRYLANALTKPIDFRRARTVVELGPGTGAVTNEILKRMRPDAKLFAVDINETFIDHLRSTCQDPRLIPLCGSATDLQSLLAQHEVGLGRRDCVLFGTNRNGPPNPHVHHAPDRRLSGSRTAP